MAITKISPSVVDFDDGITITVDDNSAALTIKSTDADSANGPIIDLVRDSASPADSDSLGMLRFKADNDAGEETIVANIKATVVDVSDGSEDGRLLLQTMIDGTSRNRIEITNTEVVVNQSGVDSDFRVESDNSANALFVQGSDGKVGINIAAPARRLLEIQDTTPGIVLHDSDVTNLTHEIVGGGNAGLEISADYQNVGTGYIRFDVGGSERARILEGGGITFNGDTAAANALNDYEEGTYTPYIYAATANGSQSYSVQNGWYTKIGNFVLVYFDISLSSNSSQSGLPYATLPFTSEDRNSYGGFSPWDIDAAFAGSGNLASGYVYPNTNRLYLYQTDGIQGHDINAHLILNQTGRISGTVTYFTSQ